MFKLKLKYDTVTCSDIDLYSQMSREETRFLLIPPPPQNEKKNTLTVIVPIKSGIEREMISWTD